MAAAARRSPAAGNRSPPRDKRHQTDGTVTLFVLRKRAIFHGSNGYASSVSGRRFVYAPSFSFYYSTSVYSPQGVTAQIPRTKAPRARTVGRRGTNGVQTGKSVIYFVQIVDFSRAFLYVSRRACCRDQIEGSLPDISIQSSHGRFFRAIGGDSGQGAGTERLSLLRPFGAFYSAHNVLL